MTEQDFITDISEYNLNQKGEVTSTSPSNIALVKYWGKIDPQIPTNPSISFTLTQSFTSSLLEYVPKKSNTPTVNVFLDDKETNSFVPKIESFFDRIQPYAPYVKEFDFTLFTKNSFPHSSGIASSASGMSALSKCLIELETELGFSSQNRDQRASFLSRLGSGSACRSVYNGLVNWGKNDYVNNSSNLYATPVSSPVHPVFKNFEDTILLIHEGSKTVSSTVGHNLMNDHPYAKVRFDQAYSNIKKLVDILASGDLVAFGKLIEHEALTLHAMMMMSNPAFILMKPNTVAVIEKVWTFRQETSEHLYFTLDAGANIHLLYPNDAKHTINKFIDTELLPYCQNRKAIYDTVNFD